MYLGADTYFIIYAQTNYMGTIEDLQFTTIWLLIISEDGVRGYNLKKIELWFIKEIIALFFYFKLQSLK